MLKNMTRTCPVRLPWQPLQQMTQVDLQAIKTGYMLLDQANLGHTSLMQEHHHHHHHHHHRGSNRMKPVLSRIGIYIAW